MVVVGCLVVCVLHSKLRYSAVYDNAELLLLLVLSTWYVVCCLLRLGCPVRTPPALLFWRDSDSSVGRAED